MTVKGNVELSIFFCDDTKLVLELKEQVVRDLVKALAEHGFHNLNSEYEDYQIMVNWNNVKYIQTRII